MTPEIFFKALRRAGFRIRTARWTRKPSDYWGTVRKRTLSKYAAVRSINGHLIAVTGVVHMIGKEVHVSATILLTSTVRKRLKLLHSVPTINSVSGEDVVDLISYGRKAESLGPCRDYQDIHRGEA